MVREDPNLVGAVVAATRGGYVIAERQPGEALDDLMEADPSLDRADQAAELRALNQAEAFRDPGEFDMAVLPAWARWEAAHGIVERPPDTRQMFVSADQLRAAGERAPAD
jgi:ABC-type nitrate/sulfonate/bicarbonate transport system substrate-binding protein